MKMHVLASTLALALVLPAVSHAQQVVGGKSVTSGKNRAINNQTAVACNFCFTCGGDWPVFAGSIRSVGDRPTERGSQCSGALTSRTDSSPFLCCR